MSTTDDSDGTKGPKAKPEDENETGSATAANPEGAETPGADDAAAKKKPEALTARRTDEQGARKTSETSAQKKKSSSSKSDRKEAPAVTAKPARRRYLGLIAALLAVFIVGGPALFMLCLSESARPLNVSVVPSGDAIACPAVAGHFTDCYLSEEITVSAPAPAQKQGFDRFCCDFIVERTLAPVVSYGDGTGSLPATLSADGTNLPLADGTRRTGNPVLRRDGGTPERRIRVISEPAFTLPAIKGLEKLLGQPLPYDVAPLIAAVVPEAAARSEHEQAVTLTEGGTMVRLNDGAGEPTQISIRARATPTLLFAKIVADGTAPENILTVPGVLPRAASGWLPSQIDGLAPAGHGEIRAAYAELRQQSVSRLAASAEAEAGLATAGRTCIEFYGAMRERFSRYDAAIATFIAAGPTGLLTSLSPADPHGCSDPTRATLSSELAADWTALDAPFVALAIPKVEETEEIASAAAEDEETMVRKVLLDLASAAKSGARLQDVKASISDPVAIRFGRGGAETPGSRDAVVRMLYRQWSHVGCWIYAAAPGSGGSAMLLAEAQYPYLNRIVLDFDAAGRIAKVEVTGVTFDDLLRFKAANRGTECQNFLNPVRLADYRDWYAVNPAGAATPADHAERLFHEGLQQKFRLN
ncbi:hypothetical protein [Nisaea sediminum]|uniref:hypothetical protein n=1 Tax=Nisaea sediminum TaxID=2775867 RepID=UPI0018666327|nr:hypothetical protein [Nisaea sediminum]